jgi:hypothetical protein
VAEPPSGAIPALGERLRDPTFGTCVTRISDAIAQSHDPLDPGGFFVADGSLYVTTESSYENVLLRTSAPWDLSRRGFFGRSILGFDPVDRRVLYAVEELQVERADLDRGIDVLVDLQPIANARFPGVPTVTAVGMSDDARIGLVAAGDGAPVGYLTIDLVSGAMLGSIDVADAPGRALISPSGRWIAFVTIDAVRVFGADLATRRDLPACCAITGSAIAPMSDGHEVLAVAADAHVRGYDLDDPSFGVRLDLVHRDPLVENVGISVGLAAAADRPGWLVATFSRCVGARCEQAYAQARIALIEIHGEEPYVLELAWHHGTEPDDRATAIASRDLTRVAFVSAWDGPSREAFVIDLPRNAVPAAR